MKKPIIIIISGLISLIGAYLLAVLIHKITKKLPQTEQIELTEDLKEFKETELYKKLMESEAIWYPEDRTLYHFLTKKKITIEDVKYLRDEINDGTEAIRYVYYNKDGYYSNKFQFSINVKNENNKNLGEIEGELSIYFDRTRKLKLRFDHPHRENKGKDSNYTDRFIGTYEISKELGQLRQPAQDEFIQNENNSLKKATVDILDEIIKKIENVETLAGGKKQLEEAFEKIKRINEISNKNYEIESKNKRQKPLNSLTLETKKGDFLGFIPNQNRSS